MMFLLNLLGGWDTLLERPVGEDEISELHYKQAMKDAVRVVRSSSSGAANKQMIRSIVIAVVSALGRAADDGFSGDDSPLDEGLEVPDWANRMLVWMLGFWVRDDNGVSVADSVVNFIVPVCICAILLLMCTYVWCCRSLQVRQVQVQINDNAQQGSVSVRFNQDLNVHVGLAAPGTPANQPIHFLVRLMMKGRRALHM